MVNLTIKDIRRGLKIGGFPLVRHSFCRTEYISDLNERKVCGGCVLTAAYCNAKNKSIVDILKDIAKKEKIVLWTAYNRIDDYIIKWAVKNLGSIYKDVVMGGFDNQITDYKNIVDCPEDWVYLTTKTKTNKQNLKRLREAARFVTRLNKLFRAGKI